MFPYSNHVTQSLGRSTTLVGLAVTVAVGLGILPLADAGGKGRSKPSAYTVVDLHPDSSYSESEARDLNGVNEVVGFSKSADGVFAVHWQMAGGGPVATILDEGEAIAGSTLATAINAGGQIVGSGEIRVEESREFRLRERGLYWSGASAIPIVLSPPDGFNACWPLGINDDGIVVGVAQRREDCIADDVLIADALTAWTGVAWRVIPGEIGPSVSAVVDLGALAPDDFSAAAAVNNMTSGMGLVTGISDVPIFDADGCAVGESSTAVYWAVTLESNGGLTASGPTPVGAFGGGPQSWAWAINDAGTICGVSETGGGALYGFLENGQLHELSALRRSSFDRQSIRDVSSTSTPQVVGHLEDMRSGAWRAVVWTDGAGASLDSLAGESEIPELVDARAINASGAIVGYGNAIDNGRHAFLMLKN